MSFHANGFQAVISFQVLWKWKNIAGFKSVDAWMAVEWSISFDFVFNKRAKCIPSKTRAESEIAFINDFSSNKSFELWTSTLMKTTKWLKFKHYELLLLVEIEIFFVFSNPVNNIIV